MFHSFEDLVNMVISDNKEKENMTTTSPKPTIEETPPIQKATETVEKPADPPALHTITLRESVSIPKVILEDEQCTPFEQCIKDGGTPEECKLQFMETQTRNKNNKAIAETINKIVDVVSQPIFMDSKNWDERIDHVQKNIENRLTTVASEIVDVTNKWNSEISKVTESIAAIKPFNDAQIQAKIVEVEAKIPKPYDDSTLKASIPKAYDDKAIKEMIVAIPKYDDAPIKTEIATMKESVKEIQTLKETMAQQKKDFETLLTVADKNISETKKTLEERIVELTKNNKDLKETVEKQEKVIKETTILSENTAEKLKPQFKGKSKDAVEEKGIINKVNPYSN
jgi:hypothetical protein